uniref:Uncharacterized protein n=1 Tax=Octopus bimaculoides TaxID=37653 RepID=A0A0L8GGB8_OCTBM
MSSLTGSAFSILRFQTVKIVILSPSATFRDNIFLFLSATSRQLTCCNGKPHCSLIPLPFSFHTVVNPYQRFSIN